MYILLFAQFGYSTECPLACDISMLTVESASYNEVHVL